MNHKLHHLLRLVAVIAMTTAFSQLSAQVKGLSYTVAPTVNYTWFDNESGINDGVLYGGYLGLGFGEWIELRGVYLRDLSSQTFFDDLGFDDAPDLTPFNDQDVDLQQYGGEMKLNIGRGKLLPFLTLGTGIQRIGIDGNEASETIYASGGLGIVFSVADRFTFTLEGRNTAYNDSPFRTLTTEDGRDVAGIDLEDFSPGDLNNLSLGLALQVYLGGRRPGTMSEIDREYANTFNREFTGASFLIEPTVSRINFDDALPYRDTYLGGAALGLNFGPLVGFRAYYLQAMEDDNLSLDFDDLSVYGADFRFRLTRRGTALSPFLTLGGGYIDPRANYESFEDRIAVSQAFGTGGGGLVLRFSPNFSLTGTYKYLLTSSNDAEDIASPDEIRTSRQWSVGLNLAFGNKADRPNVVYESEADRRVRQERAEMQAKRSAALAEQSRENQKAMEQLRKDYEDRIDGLEDELSEARKQRDTKKVDSLENKLDETQEVVEELREREDEYANNVAEAVMDSMQTDNDARMARDGMRNDRRNGGRNNARFNNDRNAPASAPNAYNYNNNRGYNRNANNGQGQIVLSPSEFQNLVEEIFEGLNGPMGTAPTEYDDYYYEEDRNAPRRRNGSNASSGVTRAEVEELRRTVDELRKQQVRTEEARKEDRAEMQRRADEILDEVRQMRKELDEKAEMSDREKRRRDRN